MAAVTSPMLTPLARPPTLGAHCVAICVLLRVYTGQTSADGENTFVRANQAFRSNPCRLEGHQHLQRSLSRAPPHRGPPPARGLPADARASEYPATKPSP